MVTKTEEERDPAEEVPIERPSPPPIEREPTEYEEEPEPGEPSRPVTKPLATPKEEVPPELVKQQARIEQLRAAQEARTKEEKILAPQRERLAAAEAKRTQKRQAQAERLAEVARQYPRMTSKQQFDTMVRLGEVPKGSQFVPGTAETKGQWGFVTPADQKRVDSKLDDFKRGHTELKPGVWYANRDISNLTASQRAELKDTGQYTVKAAAGRIPAAVEGSAIRRLEGEFFAPKNKEKRAYISLATGRIDTAATARVTTARQSPEVEYRMLSKADKAQVLGLYQAYKEAGTTPQKEAAIAYGKASLSLIPVVGTVALWNEMEPWQRGVSVAADILIVGSFVRLPGLIRAVSLGAKPTNAETKAVNALVRQDVAASRAGLRAVDPNLVKPFNALAKARAKYADNLANIAELRKTLKTRSGEVVPEIQRNLARLEASTDALADTLKARAGAFARAQNEVNKYLARTQTTGMIRGEGEVVLTGRPSAKLAGLYDSVSLQASGFADDVVRDTRHLVNMALEGNIPPVAVLDKKLIQVQKQILDLEKKGRQLKKPLEIKANAKQIGQLKQEQASLASQRAISQSGNAQELASDLTKTRIQLEKAQNELTKAQMEARAKPMAEKDWAGIIRQQKAVVARLARQEGQLSDDYIKALRGLEVEWGKPIPKSGGVGVITAPVRLPRVGPRATRAGVSPGVSVAVKAAIPSEAFGRMTREQIAREYLAAEDAIEAVGKPLAKVTPGIVPKPGPRPTPKPRPGPAPKPTPKKVPKPSRLAAPEIAPKPVPRPAAKPLPKPAPKPLPKPVPKIIPTPVKPITPRPTPKKVLPPLPRGASDSQKRKAIRQANGAIAWRHGELHGKDVWHVVKHPYRSESDYLTVMGRKPQNATIVRGPGSAKQTVKLLYGDPPARRVTGDVGFFDFSLDPIGGRTIAIEFSPDPQGRTTGDITVGRSFPLSERTTLPNRGKRPRITPKTPRLRS